MKVLVPILGAIASGLLCFVIFSLVSKYQIAQVGYTPSQSDKLIDIFIIIAPLSALCGGWASFWVYKRHLTKISSGR
ncbi:MAG: hypothetical protein KZQ95_17115 [Candidatus Thiodiazotropha sp. (ex Epidulcina cf. delphinae)]|nr:hypothetical protein [Candidatus Thiodiazotropha sp. (ex Epidulcina cf. delphinae)]